MEYMGKRWSQFLKNRNNKPVLQGSIMGYILLFIVMLGSTISAFIKSESPLLTYYSIRSQGANRARQLAGSVREYFKSYDCFYGSFSITPEYSRTFRSTHLTECLLDSQLNRAGELTISGSQVAQRSAKDWLADYFYLPPDYLSTISFKPRIENLIIDINLFLELNQWLRGLYLNLYAPFVNSHWDLDIDEKIIDPGVTAYPVGYFTPDSTARKLLNNSFIEYINGASITPINQTVTGTQFSTIFRPLQFAQMSQRKRATSRLADIRAQLGWFIVENCNEQCSFYIHASFPTGNRPEGVFLFEPMTGNGHHWELGFGSNSHILVASNQHETVALDLYLDWYITHLFRARQKRSFDLRQGPATRYMLAERINVPIVGNLAMGTTAATATAPDGQFQRDFNPIANLTTIGVDSRVSFSSELTVITQLTCCNFIGELGYNFWIRSTERIRPRGGITDLEAGTQWAIKGDAHVWGYLAANDPPFVQNQPIALSATERQATIHSGTNIPATSTVVDASKNPFIDNPLPAFGGPSVTPLLHAPGVAGIPDNLINSSLPIKYLTIEEIDFVGQNQRAHSHKFFAHFSYTWIDITYHPYIGIGGEVEFGKNNRIRCTKIEKNNCPQAFNCALSQWGMWLKGGVTFE